MMAFFNYCSKLVGFSEFPFWIGFDSILFKAILLVPPVNLKILLVIFNDALIA